MGLYFYQYQKQKLLWVVHPPLLLHSYLLFLNQFQLFYSCYLFSSPSILLTVTFWSRFFLKTLTLAKRTISSSNFHPESTISEIILLSSSLSVSSVSIA